MKLFFELRREGKVRDFCPLIFSLIAAWRLALIPPPPPPPPPPAPLASALLCVGVGGFDEELSCESDRAGGSFMGGFVNMEFAAAIVCCIGNVPIRENICLCACNVADGIVVCVSLCICCGCCVDELGGSCDGSVVSCCSNEVRRGVETEELGVEALDTRFEEIIHKRNREQNQR